MLRDGEVALIFVRSRINELQFIEPIFDNALDLLPVNLVVTILVFISILSTKVHNFRVLKIGRLKNDAPLLISFEIFIFVLGIYFGLRFDSDIPDGLASDEFLDCVLQKVHIGVVGVRNLRLDDEQLDDVVVLDFHSGEHSSDERLYISHTVLF